MKTKLCDSARKKAKAQLPNCQCSTMHPTQSRVGQLQKTIGNREVQRLYKAGKLQATLKIGQPDDVYEQEADRVAQQVMRMPEPLVQKKCRCSSGGQPCAKCAEEKEKLHIRRKADTSATSDSSVSDNFVSSLGTGQPLDVSTRAYFEPRFGMDFSHVRIHTGQRSAESASSINALAYTLGTDVVFGAGEYQPGTMQGMRLLAHELTHVAQQKFGTPPALQRLEGPCKDEPTKHVLIIRGSVHPSVREAQRKLNLFHAQEIKSGRKGLASAPLTENCVFGQSTFDAVYSFQQKVFPGMPNEHDGKIGDHTWAKLDAVSPPTITSPSQPKSPPLPVAPPPLPKKELSISIKPVIAPGSKWDTDSNQLDQLKTRVEWAKKTWMKLATIEIRDMPLVKDPLISKNGVKAEEQAALAGKLGGTNRLIILMLSNQCCQEVPDPILPFFKHTLCPDAITKQGPPPSICMSAKTMSFDSLLGHEMGHVFLKSGDHFDNGLMQLSGPYPDTLTDPLIIKAKAFFLTP